MACCWSTGSSALWDARITCDTDQPVLRQPWVSSACPRMIVRFGGAAGVEHSMFQVMAIRSYIPVTLEGIMFQVKKSFQILGGSLVGPGTGLGLRHVAIRTLSPNAFLLRACVFQMFQVLGHLKVLGLVGTRWEHKVCFLTRWRIVSCLHSPLRKCTAHRRHEGPI